MSKEDVVRSGYDLRDKPSEHTDKRAYRVHTGRSPCTQNASVAHTCGGRVISQELALSFYHTGPGDQTQVWKRLYLQSHLTSSPEVQVV